MRAKVVTVMRWYAQDEMNQEDSEQNEVDGMKFFPLHISCLVRWICTVGGCHPVSFRARQNIMFCLVLCGLLKSLWLWHGTGHVKWSNHFIHLHSRHYYHHEYHVTRGLIYTRERSDVGGLEVGWRWTRVATTQRPMYLSVLSGGWTERRTGWLPHSQCTVIM